MKKLRKKKFMEMFGDSYVVIQHYMWGVFHFIGSRRDGYVMAQSNEFLMPDMSKEEHAKAYKLTDLKIYHATGTIGGLHYYCGSIGARREK